MQVQLFIVSLLCPNTVRNQLQVLFGGDKSTFMKGLEELMFAGIFFGCHMLETRKAGRVHKCSSL